VHVSTALANATLDIEARSIPIVELEMDPLNMGVNGLTYSEEKAKLSQ
jgi:hypothetical protein